MSQNCLYFAYGANMATKVLEKRKVSKPLAWYPAIVVDKNIELAFAHRGAYATLLRRDSGKECHSTLRFSRPYGVVYELSIEDFEKIAEKEIGYETRDIQVYPLFHSGNGCEETCGLNSEAPVLTKAFFSSFWTTLPDPMPPTHRYMSVLVEGALEHGLNEEYIEWLKQVPSVETKCLADPRYSRTNAETLARTFVLLVLVCFIKFFF
ncbi:hypothetical protein M9435_004574 [Picochlorum sp. BPE23]|nr:hypothetical protein M9435_004574 [Picochlorum sp. BPE23]